MQQPTGLPGIRYLGGDMLHNGRFCTVLVEVAALNFEEAVGQDRQSI
jgi:hypothetical protein